MTVRRPAAVLVALMAVAATTDALGTATWFRGMQPSSQPDMQPDMQPGVFADLDGYNLTPHHDYPAIDLPTPTGTPIRAPWSGTVTHVSGDCGNGLKLTAPNGDSIKLCHGTTVHPPHGTTVTAGDLILTTGWSGRVEPAGPAGAHLHLEIRAAQDPRDAHRCPGPWLTALRDRTQPPPFNHLPTSGCVK